MVFAAKEPRKDEPGSNQQYAGYNGGAGYELAAAIFLGVAREIYHCVVLSPILDDQF